MTLAWMVVGLLGSGTVQLSAWEAYVSVRARLAQSYQRRWSRFLSNLNISPLGLYLPLVLAAMSKHEGKEQRPYLVLDTSVLWNRY